MQGLHGDDQEEEAIMKMGRIGLGDAGKLDFRSGRFRTAGLLRSTSGGSGGASGGHRAAERLGLSRGTAGSGAGGRRRRQKKPGRVGENPKILTRRGGERIGGKGDCFAKM